MKIRLAGPEDFDRLAEIYVRSYNTLGIGETWDEPSAKKLIAHLYQGQPDLFFAAENDEGILGAICAWIKPWWDGSRLTDGEVFVAPEYQHGGIGTKLIRHLFVQAKEKYQAVSWDTFTHVIHKHPLAWYKAMGFEEINEWTMIRGDIDLVLAKMDKRGTAS